MLSRHGFTIMEIMFAVSMATFMAAIGFTGISAFGKSVTRSKQFTSESEMVIACMRMAIKEADAGQDRISATSGPLPVPRNWTTCTISSTDPSVVEFTIATTLAGNIASAGGGGGVGQTNVRNALNMSGNSNTIIIKTVKSNY